MEFQTLGIETRVSPSALCDSHRSPPCLGCEAVDVPVDHDLLQRCRCGESAAWTEVVTRYERLVFSTALRNGLTRDDAADVTQTTFIALFNSIDQVRDVERLPFWLITVARRQAWRACQGRHEYQQLPDDVACHDDPIGDWERSSVVYNALQRLDSPCRDLLCGLFLDPAEPSYVEMARRLGRAVGGIGPLRGRCLTHLREILGEGVFP
ncbi:sigma-70 family RNA polymerase sigma factor [Rhodococcus spelaei]|uniref:Sigma-70 family RNA polymerase sigma factor n=1 Tax=Rhodococcus spelaei TaxID=2546320 RepID=A0A541BNP9_9NOCA|nr:sigma-70 family RNA polymerase sigma factor [Rhodococcus spelaei]TQF73946.1 sigma-70 family RNA polymerase sigma factor [Rhodococcus spelaei]